MKLRMFVVLMSVMLVAQERVEKRLCGFGSSVCSGAIDEMTNGGYIGRLRDRLAAKGWTVLNASRGSDNTTKIQERWDPSCPKRSNITIKPEQYLLPQKPGYVFVGLSLNNEGLTKAKDEAGDAAVAAKWVAGMQGIFGRLRASNIKPIMGNCYPNLLFTPDDYASTKAMNLQIHQWDVPSANFLGALDDGNGKWCPGFFYNEGHPNSSGHQEMMEAIVPSLFDALKSGKAQPASPAAHGGLRFPRGSAGGILCEPEFPPHAFTLVFRFKAGGNLSLLEMGMLPQAVTYSDFTTYQKKQIQIAKWIGNGDEKRMRLTLTAGRLDLDGQACGAAPNDGQWHSLAITGRPAAHFIKVWVDGVERFNLPATSFLKNFTVFPACGDEGSLKDIFLYRSAMGSEELQALAAGDLLQSSLEVYAPLNDPPKTKGEGLANLAQSLTPIKLMTSGTRPNPKP